MWSSGNHEKAQEIIKIMVDVTQRVTPPKKKFEAAGKKIIVWVEPPPDKHGQLHMPDGSKTRMATPIGRVIAVGPNVSKYEDERRQMVPIVREGDRILVYDATMVTEIRYDGDVLYAVEENSIVGILSRK